MNSPFIINLMYFERMKNTENKGKVNCVIKKENEKVTGDNTKLKNDTYENDTYKNDTYKNDTYKNSSFLNSLTIDNMMKYVNF